MADGSGSVEDTGGERQRETGMSRPEATSPDPDESRWRAVVRRDASAAGDFVIGVKTTGIFCRPGCPARTPLRENVAFFDDSGAAAAAGFRACKRCKPLEAGQ